MKQKKSALVLSQKMIAPGIFDLWLKTDLAYYAHAGQFIGVYPKDKSTLLPRPISICEVSDTFDALRLVYRVAGKGTDEFSKLKENDTVDILGILGNGYMFEEIFDEKFLSACQSAKGSGHQSSVADECLQKTNDERSSLAGSEHLNVVLMGGGIGIPPMLELAKELRAHNIDATVIAGYRDANLFLNLDLAKYQHLEVATEDGSVGVKGNVLNVVAEKDIQPDVIMACGPMPMLRAIKRYTENCNRNVKAYISLEERMACGVGACLGCVCKTTKVDHHSHVNNARICTDGPVFDADDVEI